MVVQQEKRQVRSADGAGAPLFRPLCQSVRAQRTGPSHMMKLYNRQNPFSLRTPTDHCVTFAAIQLCQEERVKQR